MAIQLYIGLITEGSTDSRFLPDIIERLFIEIAHDCRSDIIIESIFPIHKDSGTFVETMLSASKQANEHGATILCVHIDSDDASTQNVNRYKMQPYLDALAHVSDTEYCKNVIPIIPIQMIESWMMADKELLKQRINANSLRDEDLGLHRHPEQYANPKLAIETAISIAQRGQSRKKRNIITIADLYEELGALLTLPQLRQIPSFRSFEQNARQVFRRLDYLE